MFADHAGGKFIVVPSIRLDVKAHPFEIGFMLGASRGGREDVDPLLTVELGAFFEQEFPGAEIAISRYDKIEKDASLLLLGLDDDQSDRQHVAKNKNDHLHIVGLELIGGNEFGNIFSMEFEEALEIGAVGTDLHQGEVIAFLPHAPKVIGIDAQGEAVEQDDRKGSDKDAIRDEKQRTDHIDNAQAL